MMRYPTIEQFKQLLFVYHGCNDRIMNPIYRLMLESMPLRKVMQKVNWEITHENEKKFTDRLRTYHHYYSVYFNVETEKIIVFNILTKTIEGKY